MLKVLRNNAEVVATIILVASALILKPHADDVQGILIVAGLLIIAFISRDIFRLSFANRTFNAAAPWRDLDADKRMRLWAINIARACEFGRG